MSATSARDFSECGEHHATEPRPGGRTGGGPTAVAAAEAAGEEPSRSPPPREAEALDSRQADTGPSRARVLMGQVLRSGDLEGPARDGQGAIGASGSSGSEAEGRTVADAALPSGTPVAPALSEMAAGKREIATSEEPPEAASAQAPSATALKPRQETDPRSLLSCRNEVRPELPWVPNRSGAVAEAGRLLPACPPAAEAAHRALKRRRPASRRS